MKTVRVIEFNVKAHFISLPHFKIKIVKTVKMISTSQILYDQDAANILKLSLRRYIWNEE